MLEKNPQPEKSEPRPGPEIEALRERVEQLEAQLKKERPPVIPEKKEKAVKREIKNYLRELQHTPPSAAPPAVRDEAQEVAKFPPSQQVGALVSLVFEKDLKEAVSVARALDNPAILDEFHDTLVDRYYKELIKREIIKE